MKKVKPFRSHVEGQLLNVSVEKQKQKESNEIKLPKDNRSWIIEKNLKKYAKSNKSCD